MLSWAQLVSLLSSPIAFWEGQSRVWPKFVVTQYLAMALQQAGGNSAALPLLSVWMQYSLVG